MLRSPGDSDSRHTTPLCDNKHDTSIKGSKDSTPPISKPQIMGDGTEQYVRDPAIAQNALQESAYRLHALVKRNSPQKIPKSPIRFNKTEPLPSISKSLNPPRKSTGGPATGGVGKAPPSPRRSPLRRGSPRDTVAGAPQTKNVVERMIAYARHAASQEDPGMVQQDRQNFVTRLANRSDRSGTAKPEALKESPVLSSSPRTTSQAAGAFPILSNLSMHANLKKKHASHTAPLSHEEPQDDSQERKKTTHTANIPDAKVLRSGVPDLGLDSHEIRSEHISDSVNDIFEPVANHNAALTSSTKTPPPSTSINNQASIRDKPSIEPQHGHLSIGSQPANQHNRSIATTPSTPQTTRSNALSPSVSSHEIRRRPPQDKISTNNFNATSTQWDREKWRVFIQAVKQSFGTSSITISDTVGILNVLIQRLPPDMRTITVQELAHRLNAWIRSTSKVTKG